MPDDRTGRGLPEELRSAVERTFAATAGSRERAQELLDEAVRRGAGARERLEKELESLRARVGELESALGRATSRNKKD